MSGFPLLSVFFHTALCKTDLFILSIFSFMDLIQMYTIIALSLWFLSYTWIWIIFYYTTIYPPPLPPPPPPLSTNTQNWFRLSLDYLSLLLSSSFLACPSKITPFNSSLWYMCKLCLASNWAFINKSHRVLANTDSLLAKILDVW